MQKNSTLEDVKSLVSQKYLGKAGIHGVGMRRSKSAVAVYVDPEDRLDRQEVLSQIEKEIKPFNLLVVEEGRASIT
ncbi:MAG TPA: hypothetical protein VF546_16665 [Pyrinomonadaceae bacterium]|jgi:hypothetical protein